MTSEGQAPTRKLMLGAVIDDSLRMVSRSPWLFFSVGFVPVYTVPVLTQIVGLDSTRLPTPEQIDQTPWTILLVSLMRLFVMSLLWTIAIAVVSWITQDCLMGIKPTLATALRNTPGSIQQVVGTHLAAVVFFPAAIALSFLVGMVLVLPLGPFPERVGATLGGFVMLATTGAAICLLCSFSLAPAIASLEGLRDFPAMRRSWNLTRGNRAKVAAIAALYLVLLIPASAVASVLFFLPGAVRTLFTAVVMSLPAVLVLAAQARTYFELRSIHEGHELEILADRILQEEPSLQDRNPTAGGSG